MSQLLRRGGLVLALVVGIAAVSVAAAYPDSGPSPLESQLTASASQAEEDEVVLPSRVAAAIERSQNAVDRTEARVDDAQYAAALKSLAALAVDITRAHKAGVQQMNAEPADPEAETTPGPDSVIAVLALEQASITRLAGMFDRITNSNVVSALDAALAAAGNKRKALLNTVVGLDPEGAGADYADGMADTVDGYADEVANLTEALKVDQLSSAGRAALTRALARANAAAETVNAAFGGGE
jgi:hypothetical protein